MGFDEESNVHRVYWPDRRMITVERSVKFDDNHVLIPSAVPFKGEKDDTK